jgi:archaemetzincin
VSPNVSPIMPQTSLTSRMTQIQIVPVGHVDRDILEFLSTSLGETIGAHCIVSPQRIDPGDAFNAERRQYNSTQILSRLLENGDGAGGKLLGVADVDLFIPVLTFVFGEAQLENRAAVMSVHRLRQQFYGLPANERLFYERCEKEAVHELGHAFGLVHCRNFECVMHFSNSIDQVDLKTSEFCEGCGELLLSKRACAR